MKLVKVGSATLNQTPLDWRGNTKRIVVAINMAKEEGVSLLCLPELCITGYGCEDALFSPDLQNRAFDQLCEISAKTFGIAVCLGLPLYHRNALYNVASLVGDGTIAGFVAKRHLAGDGVHYEPRWFKPWPRDVCDHLERASIRYPIGDLVFDLGGIRVGFEICEDAWGAHRPGVDLVSRAVDVILNPSASHFAFGKHEVRKRFVVEGSRAFGVTYIYSNLHGNEAGRLIYDGGAMIASSGKFLAVGPRFSYRDVTLVHAVVDVSETRMLRSRIAAMPTAIASSKTWKECDSCCEEQVSAYAEEEFERDRGICFVPFSFPDARVSPNLMSVADWETSLEIRKEEFARAAALGLFDYMRKSNSRGFVVSLSGGADSSAAALLVYFALSFSIKELGLRDVMGRLNCSNYLKVTPESVEEITNQLLTCVYQSTRNSSEETRNAACSLANSIGARFLEFDLDAIVQDYQEKVEQVIGRKLHWERDDIALQNIQARVRAPSVWMLANLQRALLVATSNRSEVAVGYATMDGDTAGSIAPLAGIDKVFIREWLKWVQHIGPSGLGALPVLDLVTRQAPSAELRPQTSKQTDEDDLMPYPLLNEIEALAIRDKLAPGEVMQHLVVSFPELSKSDLQAWVGKFFRLWSNNQWKRERYAPSFHYDDRNLDPRSWCRFPILSGGFEEELSEIL